MEARNVSFLGKLCLRTKCMIPIKKFLMDNTYSEN